MPFYEYHCEACGKDFTLMRPVSFKTEEAECPHCKEKKATKKISLFSSTGSDHASCGTGSFGGGG